MQSSEIETVTDEAVSGRIGFRRTNQTRASELVDVLIMDCVKNGMSILGGSGTAAILYHIEARFSLGELQIPHDPNGFVSALSYIFGTQAKIIVRAIVEEMRKNATCDRGFLRFASALETSAGGESDEANYLATENAQAAEITNEGVTFRQITQGDTSHE